MFNTLEWNLIKQSIDKSRFFNLTAINAIIKNDILRNKQAEKRSKQSQQAYITKSKVTSEDLHYCPSRCTQQASTSPNNQSPNNHGKLQLHQTITAIFYFTKPEKSEPVPNLKCPNRKPNKSLFSWNNDNSHNQKLILIIKRW